MTSLNRLAQSESWNPAGASTALTPPPPDSGIIFPSSSIQTMGFLYPKSPLGLQGKPTELPRISDKSQPYKIMAGKFEIKKTASGQFMFNLKAGNGEIILTSEQYVSKAGASNGIASVRTNSQIDSRFEERTSTGGSPYFVLKASNGEIIGRSEMYSSTSAMKNGIGSVKSNAPSATVSDLT